METPVNTDLEGGEIMPAEPNEAIDTVHEPVPFEDLPTIDEAPAPPAGIEAMYDVAVKVQAVLGRSRMSVAELMQIRSGHVIELDRKVGEPIDIFVNNRLIARGEVVMVDNSLGVTLTEIVRQED